MQQFLIVPVVVVWILTLLCGSAVSKSCAKTTTITTTTTTTTTTTVPGACGTKSSAPLTTTETLSPPRAAEKGRNKESEVVSPDSKSSAPSTTSETNAIPPASQKWEHIEAVAVSPAQLHGSWSVLAGYTKDFAPIALCPNLTLYVDPDDSNNITVSWSNTEPYENVIPQGEMTMIDHGHLVDKSGFKELHVLKLDKFLVLRARNGDFIRAFVLARPSATEGLRLGDLLGYMMPWNAELEESNVPEWYICPSASISELPPSGDNEVF